MCQYYIKQCLELCRKYRKIFVYLYITEKSGKLQNYPGKTRTTHKSYWTKCHTLAFANANLVVINFTWL
jgi:hypothetical protein